MRASVVYQAFQFASRFVTGDTDAAPKSPTVHTSVRYMQVQERPCYLESWQ